MIEGHEVIEIPRIERHFYETPEGTITLYYIIYRDMRQAVVTDIYTENEYKEKVWIKKNH